MRTKIRNQILCTLLTLALCIGLVPGTALAATDLDIYTTIKNNNKLSDTDGDDTKYIANGYKWAWDGTSTGEADSNNPKTLDITLKNCTVDGKLNLPDDCKITITLEGNNTINGDNTGAGIGFNAISSNSADYQMIICGSGTLTVKGTIGMSSSDGDTLIVKDGANVTVKKVAMGASGNASSYIEVDGNGSILTIEENSPVTGMEATNCGKIIAKKGITIAEGASTSPNSEKYKNKVVIDATGYIELGSPSNTNAALRTESYTKTGSHPFESFLQDKVIIEYLPKNEQYQQKNETGSGGQNTTVVADANSTVVKYLKLGVYHKIIMKSPDSDGGTSSADKTEVLYGETVTLTNNPPTNKVLDYWKVKEIKETQDGYEFTGNEVNLNNSKFGMYSYSVEIEPVYKNADGSTSPGDDDGGKGNGSHRTRWYDIEVIQPEHGFLEAPEKGYKNLGIDMILTLEDGYALDEILVTNKDGTETFKVRKDEKKDDTYQFTMPAKDVIVTPILKQVEQKQETPYILLTVDQTLAWVFNQWKTLDAPPILREDRVMLPARFVIEALGGTVAWDADAQEVTIQKDGKTIVITIGAESALVDGKEVALDAPAFIENGRTYLPIRFIAENLGASVSWDSETKQVTITKAD